MEKYESVIKRPVNRRSLLKSGMLAGGAAVVGAGLFSGAKSAFGQDSGGGLTKGDVAILRFLAAAEFIESDPWTQYAELGGIGDPPIEIDPNQQLNSYQAALSNFDGDGPQYITSGDEIAHFLEWVDFAGNGVQAPVAPVSGHGLTFPDFSQASAATAQRSSAQPDLPRSL